MINKILIFGAVLFCFFSAKASTFTTTQNLSFGTLVPVTTSGSVTVNLNSTITTNGVATVAPSGTTYYAGRALFHGTGLSSGWDLITKTFLSSSAVLTNGTGGTVMVDNFNVTQYTFVSSIDPDANISIGATMNFTAASTPGNYIGSIQLRGSGLSCGTATTTIPIILTFWRPLSISQTTKLNFGGIEIRGGNSVVRIAPQTSARTVTSGAAGINLIASKPGTAGSFAVVGNPNTAVTITLPSTTTLTGPGAAMMVNNFTRFPSGGATLNASGNLNLQVGADLQIGTSQAAGTYNGTYNVTVSY